MKKIQGIYKIRNCINGKVYIGQSVDITRRFKMHECCVIRGYKHPLYNSINKYGIENFEFIVIEEIDNVNLLDIKEQSWMDHYKSYDRNYGYNICKESSSKKGYNMSDDTKLKISKANTGKKRSKEVCEKLSKLRKGKIPWNKGIKHSEETKRKISETNKGQISVRKGCKHTEESKLKMSLSRKGHKVSDETKLKISKNRKDHKVSDETKSKISLKHKGKKLSTEHKLKISQANKGRDSGRKGKKHILESKVKMSLSLKEAFRNKKLGRKRLTVEDKKRIQQFNIIKFKQAM